MIILTKEIIDIHGRIAKLRFELYNSTSDSRTKALESLIKTLEAELKFRLNRLMGS